MFEAVRKNKRVAQVILAIVIVPFAFFGMDAYFSDAPGGAEVATVGGSPISAAEFEQALREQQDRLRNAGGGEVNREMLESDELRSAVLDNLINQRALALYSAENRLVVTPAQLQETIAELPAFQEDGRFSLARYESLLRAQGMTPAIFESRLAQDVRIQQVALSVGNAGFAPAASARRFLDAQLEERVVRELRFPVSKYAAAVEPTEEEIRRYYEANPGRFERPARLKAEYLVFDRAAVESGITLGEDELRAFYDGNPGRFGVPEERRARHILLQLDAEATQAEVEKVTAQAQALVEELRKDASRFEALAKEHSQDTGSAERGGDLGFFGRGMMVGAFEDATFAQAKDEIGEPVRSDFGIHIIQVTDIKPTTMRTFDEVRDEIAAELKGQAASRRFAELAEQFSNTVYEQADSLKPAAELLKLEVQRTDWVTRDAEGVGPFDSDELVAALFSDDAVKNRRNTEAVEVAANTLVSARVTEFEAAQRLPLEEVKGRIETLLKTAAAASKAREQGEAALAALRKGDQAGGEWGAERRLQRGAPSLSAEAMQAVFTASTATLPAYVGLTAAEGDYLIYRIDSVERPEIAADDARIAAVAAQYRQLIAQRDFGAFLTELRQRYEVEVKLRPTDAGG